MTSRYGDREDDRERYGRRAEEEYGRSGQGYGGRGREERGFFDRAGDEVRTWFGDEEAERRRRRGQARFSRGEGPDVGSYDRAGVRGFEYGREGDYGQRAAAPEGPSRGASGRDDERGSEYDRQRYSGEREYGSQSRSQFGGAGREPWSFSYAEIWLIPGPFTGRGPRGYRRSDERITEDVCERLMQHGQVDASQIQVNVKDGEVTLSGTVPSRQAKRLAEDAAESVSGVKDVQNQLRVSQGEQHQPGQMAQSGQSSQSATQDQAERKQTAKPTAS